MQDNRYLNPKYASLPLVDQSIKRTQRRLVELHRNMEAAKKTSKTRKIDLKREGAILEKLVSIRIKEYQKVA